MRKICIINQKGGVGKTTTAVNLGAGLSRKNKKVLIIDLDPQANIKLCFNDDSEKGVYDFLFENANIKDCIKNLGANLDIMPSKENLTKAEVLLAKESDKEKLLKKKLEKLKGYDYVLLDCPPSLGLLNQNAMLYAEEAFIPVSTDFLGLKGLQNVTHAIKNVNEFFDHDLKITKVIPTMYDKRIKICTKVLNQIKNDFYEVVSDPIRVNSKLKEAPEAGMSIFKYSGSSRGAKDYGALVNQVINDEGMVKNNTLLKNGFSTEEEASV